MIFALLRHKSQINSKNKQAEPECGAWSMFRAGLDPVFEARRPFCESPEDWSPFFGAHGGPAPPPPSISPLMFKPFKHFYPIR